MNGNKLLIVSVIALILSLKGSADSPGFFPSTPVDWTGYADTGADARCFCPCFDSYQIRISLFAWQVLHWLEHFR